MNELIRTPEFAPDSYQPKDKPEIIEMVAAATEISINGEIVPFLFKKEIIHLPSSKLVGKKVTYPIAKQGKPEEDGGNPHLSLLWDKCGEDGTFNWLETQKESKIMEAHLGLYFDINKNGEGTFSYLVGALMKNDAVIPDEFDFHKIPESDIAVCWFKYKEDVDIWAEIDPHKVTAKFMAEQNYMDVPDVGWCSELYPDGSFPTEDGYNILGYVITCRKKDV